MIRDMLALALSRSKGKDEEGGGEDQTEEAWPDRSRC